MRLSIMVAPWLPYEPLRVYKERSPEKYVEALSQFNVETSLRYRPWGGAPATTTYCNIFLWDGLRALGISNPSHWVDKEGNAHTPLARDARPLRANDFCKWFVEHGARYGWRRVDTPTARDRVARGLPVVLAWENTHGGPGHVAFLMPDGKSVIQAGRTNGVMSISKAFGARLYVCWTHD